MCLPRGQGPGPWLAEALGGHTCDYVKLGEGLSVKQRAVLGVPPTQQSQGQCLSLRGEFLQQLLLFMEMFPLRSHLCAQGLKDRKTL